MATLELVVISLVILLLTLFVRWLISWRRRSVLYSLLPGPKQQNVILGDLPIIIGRSQTTGITFHVMLLQSLLALSHLYRKDGLCRVWLSYDPVIFVYSSEALEPILTSQTILTKGMGYDFLHSWLGTGLLTSTGNKWRHRRKLLTPTFHYSILDSFIPIFDHHSKAFVKKLTLVKEDWIDIIPLVPLFTLDVICETAMGIKLERDKAESRDYANAVAEFAEMLMEVSVKPWLQNNILLHLTAGGKKMRRVLRTLLEFSSKVVKRRKEELLLQQRQEDHRPNTEDPNVYGRKNRKAFLDLLLEMQFLKNALSDEDICEEVNTFMFEGYDTVSAGISWTLYHLGHHPEIQEKVYEEIQQIFGDDKDRQVTPNDLREMKYLECVIKESQRISPSVPMFERAVTEDITIKGYTIPRGATISVFVYSLHRDPSVFPDPEVFDPDRFLPENSVGRSPFAYIPFSAGPRNCIGQKFAMMELKISLCNIVRNFVVRSFDPPDKVNKTALLILRPEKELRLKFTKRE